jgi:Tfp pilus assembly protein PilO
VISVLGQLQKLAQDKKKLAIAAVIFVILLYADFALVVGSQIKGVKDLKAKIIALRKDIDTLNNDIKYVKKNADSGAAPVKVKKLISEKEIPSLMQNISVLANENGVRIMQIDSVKEVPKTSKKSAPGKDGKAAKDAKASKASKAKDASASLISVKIKMDVISGYHKLGNFINEIENADRFCMIEDLLVIRDPADSMKHKISLAVKAYVRK